MPEEVRMWRISSGDELTAISRFPLDVEARLERWLERDISVLDPGLLVIGRQVATDFGGVIDLLCLDAVGDVVVVELKRDKTPREITAQVLDYGSWVEDLSNERIRSIAETHLGTGKLEPAFKARFEVPLPDTLNEEHRLMIVGSQIDESSERIVRYLSGTYGVNINAATFQCFKDGDGSAFLARVFLIEPDEVEESRRKKGDSKRRPNLTYEELGTVAEEKGVGDLYKRAVKGLEPYLQKHTTRSSIGFAKTIEGSRKTVVSFVPEGSSAGDGLKFQVYFQRLCAVLGQPAEAVLGSLPGRRERWSYSAEPSGDYDGYEGFFADVQELDRFLDVFSGGKKG